jgi:hypothetical protein
MTAGVTVRGAATDEEIAVVLAVLTAARPQPVPTPYERWREVRRAARRRTARMRA